MLRNMCDEVKEIVTLQSLIKMMGGRNEWLFEYGRRFDFKFSDR